MLAGRARLALVRKGVEGRDQERTRRRRFDDHIDVAALCSDIRRRELIDVFLRLQEQPVSEIVVKVRDAGKPFNPVHFLDEQGEEFSGLLMVRKLTTKIEYARILGFNTTIVTIGKRGPK